MKFDLSVLLLTFAISIVHADPDVDTRYPYEGPEIPIGDWVDYTVNGNGKGFPRLVEPPAVVPKSDNPTNNVNVISISYIPDGVNIHYQTPFGLGEAPSVKWGETPELLNKVTSGYSHTYDRTPPCSLIAAVTQCSQFFHEVQLPGLEPDTTYYYQIPAANGTTESDVLSFTTAREAGDKTAFTLALLADMGYTNAQGTYKYLVEAVNDEDDPISFVWHGGDLSYADDWYSGILPCQLDSWPVCYNGTDTSLPGPGAIPAMYDMPLPAGEIANQGGPYGGDMNVIYESNWDLWQNWMNNVTLNLPYMVLPGNHEASCAEFDGPGNIMTAYLNEDIINGTAAESDLTYYSCPPSQRNFTAFQHRFRMPGEETKGVGNFWYSFDYGMAHFISFDGETDYANSPEWPFARDVTDGEKLPTENQTWVTDSGPFGAVDGSYDDNDSYEQLKWLKEDLASVDREKTPWLFVFAHRPMYASQVSSYQAHMRDAFESLFLEYGVDVYHSGHIHYYERLLPLGLNATIDYDSIVNNHTYYTNNGESMTYIISGQAGNVESHSTLDDGESPKPYSVMLDVTHYGFLKVHVYNETTTYIQVINGADGEVEDYLWLLKPEKSNSTSVSTATENYNSTTPMTTATTVATKGSGEEEETTSVTYTTTVPCTTESSSTSMTAITSVVSSVPAVVTNNSNKVVIGFFAGVLAFVSFLV